jgi:cell division cycle 20-like protein 1, cofactor of APC complex
MRKIPKVPFKVLDAPELQDDFYLNLVDWSSTNVLGVGLGTSVYLWSACTSQVTKLCDLANREDSVSSVSWSEKGNYIAVGTFKGDVQIWDAAASKLLNTLNGHTARVGALAWNHDLLCSGSRDRNVFLRDIRVPAYEGERKLTGHKQEVCGLKWSPDHLLLASGGNDNKLLVWNVNGGNTPIQTYNDHIAAVKAIAWSPHQHGLLASGGGTADRCIRFWNTLTGQNLQYVDTGSQVCNLAWSKHSNELVSTHGYSQNQILIWKYPSMVQLAKLTGHSYRVLYLAVSPDGEAIVTGAGDETLRFWNVFNKSRCTKVNFLIKFNFYKRKIEANLSMVFFKVIHSHL